MPPSFLPPNTHSHTKTCCVFFPKHKHNILLKFKVIVILEPLQFTQCYKYSTGAQRQLIVLLHPILAITGSHALFFGCLIIHFIFIQKICPSILILTSLGFHITVLEHIQIDYSKLSDQALLIDINRNIALLKLLFVGVA